MDPVNRVQILHEPVGISLSANTLRYESNYSPYPTMSKQLARLESCVLTHLGEGKQ